MNTRLLRFVALAAVTLGIAGCGQTITGTAAPGEIDVRKLDVGRFPTMPLGDYYEYSHSVRSGTSLAVTRLADSVVLGDRIDPKLAYGTGIQSITRPGDVKNALSDQGVAVAERNGLMFGWMSGSSDVEPIPNQKVPASATLTTVTVMQFPDAGSAANAAREFEDADFAVAADTNQRVPLAKYPEAYTHWRPGTPTIGSTAARGNYVVNVFASTASADLALLTSLVEKTYAAQFPELDKLAPLTKEQVMRLDLDPEGMKQRILNPNKIGVPSVGSLATYRLNGFLHFQPDRERARRIYAEAGAEYITFSEAYSEYTTTYSKGIAQAFGTSTSRLLEGAILTRTRDDAAAEKLSAAIMDKPDAGMTPAGLPDTRCGEIPRPGSNSRDFSCVLRYRNYVAHVWGTQIQDAQQRAAAQYALLANSA
ncbi:DUF7373 family lipoprotein [Nocardia thailandica]